MPEKFRQIKREQPRFIKSFLRNPFGVAGLVLILAAAAGWGGWFYFDKSNDGQVNRSQVKEVDHVLAAVVCRIEQCFWLNKNGVSFNQSGKTAGNLILSLEDKTSRELKVGTELLNAKTLAELSFLRQRIYEDLSLGLRAGETADSNFSDFDFITSEGWILRLSLAENAYKTLETLKKTLEEIKKTAPSAGLEYIDLRVPNKVYYKFR